MRNQPMLIVSAVAVIYIVLGVLYESLVHPLTIISTLPSAGMGALLALQLTGGQLNLISLLGIILLMGIVKKNGILLVDFAIEARRRRRTSALRAIMAACRQRFRPITMTTLTALLGALPLALASGPSGALRQPLGIAVVGGLLASQMLTLYTTPVVYLALDRAAGWRKRRRERQVVRQSASSAFRSILDQSHRSGRQTTVQVTAADDRPPVVKRDLQGLPVGDPAENEKALREKFAERSRSEPERNELVG